MNVVLLTFFQNHMWENKTKTQKPTDSTKFYLGQKHHSKIFSEIQIWALCRLRNLFLYGHQFAHGARSCGTETGSPQTVAKKLEAQNSFECHYTQLHYNIYWN